MGIQCNTSEFIVVTTIPDAHTMATMMASKLPFESDISQRLCVTPFRFAPTEYRMHHFSLFRRRRRGREMATEFIGRRRLSRRRNHTDRLIQKIPLCCACRALCNLLHCVSLKQLGGGKFQKRRGKMMSWTFDSNHIN